MHEVDDGQLVDVLFPVKHFLCSLSTEHNIAGRGEDNHHDPGEFRDEEIRPSLALGKVKNLGL